MIKHIYIHIPFCKNKCGYCSFYSVVKYNVEEYLEALFKEIALYDSKYQITPETIYFGGGTPSLLNPNDIKKILAKFNLKKTKEITLEANPSTINPKKISEYKNIGINRFSIGTQSMLDKELDLLGRQHSSETINSCLEKNIENFSFDLIYGLPYQTIGEVEYSINEMLKMNPPHFSIYCLNLEENVPLHDMIFLLPSDDKLSEMYFKIKKILEKKGYIHYELSSFCKEGYQSSHNLAYWSGEYYLGLGAGASGFLPATSKPNHQRYQNHYLYEYINNEDSFVQQSTPVSHKEFEKEYIITGLRKMQGISIKDINEKFNINFKDKYAKTIKKLAGKGMIEIDTHIRITKKYYFLSNEIMKEFV